MNGTPATAKRHLPAGYPDELQPCAVNCPEEVQVIVSNVEADS